MKKNSDFFESLKCAINGIVLILKSERNFKIDFFVFIFVIILSYLFKISMLEFYILLIMCCIVMSFEILNTVIEKILDYISIEYSENIRTIKDMAAGLVLITAFFAFIIGLFIFVPKILKFIGEF